MAVHLDRLSGTKCTGSPRHTDLIVHRVDFKLRPVVGPLEGPPAPEDGRRVGDKGAEVWNPQIGGPFPRTQGCQLCPAEACFEIG